MKGLPEACRLDTVFAESFAVKPWTLMFACAELTTSGPASLMRGRGRSSSLQGKVHTGVSGACSIYKEGGVGAFS